MYLKTGVMASEPLIAGLINRNTAAGRVWLQYKLKDGLCKLPVNAN
jgi:hypothetical protein